MNTQLTTTTNNVDTFFDTGRLGNMLAIANEFVKSGAFGRDVQNAHQAFVKIQAGYEIGMPPMEAMQSFYIVNGKTTLWGAAVLKRIKEAGWKVEYPESSREKCTVTISKGDEKYTESISKADIKLDGAYKFAPVEKLRYAAIARIAKFYIPEVLSGYSNAIKEDLEDSDYQSPEPVIIDATSKKEVTFSSPANEVIASIKKFATKEQLDDFFETVLPRVAKNYTDIELEAISTAIKEKAESLPKVKKEPEVVEGEVIDKKEESKEEPKEEKPVKAKKVLKVEKIEEVKKEPEPIVEQKAEEPKKINAQDVVDLFEDQKISKSHAEQFEAYIAANSIDVSPKLTELGKKNISDLTIEEGRALKEFIIEALGKRK